MGENRYFIGLDGGTQSTKVVIFDRTGQVVARAQQALQPLDMPEAGVAEHPGDDLWDSARVALKGAMQSFPHDPNEIAGIGVCTIRCCRALLDKDGNLAHPVLNWMDARIRANYEHTDPAVRYVTTTTGYAHYRLTGEKKDTAANLKGEWPIDCERWDWFEEGERFRAFGIPREMLFELVLPGTVVGHVTARAAEETGLPEGLPVVATANDKAVEALGAGLLPGPTGLVSLGTYITSMVYGRDVVGDAASYWTNMASIPYHYLYESDGIGWGMSTVSWFRDLLGAEVTTKAREQGMTPEDYLNREAAEVPPGCYGLMTVPRWLTFETPRYGRGIMMGFEGRHGREHIYRSILEGIAFTIHMFMSDMTGEMQFPMEDLIVSGGGSNSDLCMQILADVFGLPARRNRINESVALGCALCVAVALGAAPDYQTAIAEMVAPEDAFVPDMENHALYARIIQEVFRHIPAETEGLQRRSHAIFHPADGGNR